MYLIYRPLSSFYQILGVRPSASVAEIKKAFRKKAHLLHPDVNKAPDAEERWQELYEAYEYLLQRRKVRKAKPGSVHAPGRQKAQAGKQSYAEWKAREREKARAQARAHARMKFAAFKKTAYYQNEIALEVLGDNFMFYSLLFLCLYAPYAGLQRDTSIGFFLALVLGVAGIPIWIGALKKGSNIRLALLRDSLYKILQSRVFSLVALSLLNVVLYLLFAFRTFVPLFISLGALVLAGIAGYLWIQKGRLFPNNAYTRSVSAFVLFPGLVNLFFAVNFLLAQNTQVETYAYKVVWARSSARHDRQPSPFIQLSNNTYKAYPGLRFFWGGDKITKGGLVEFHIARGPFGLRVLREHRFLRQKRE